MDTGMRELNIKYRTRAPQMPSAIIGQAITIFLKGKKMPGKITAFNNQTRLIEATANGKKYLGERSGDCLVDCKEI